MSRPNFCEDCRYFHDGTLPKCLHPSEQSPPSRNPIPERASFCSTVRLFNKEHCRKFEAGAAHQQPHPNPLLLLNQAYAAHFARPTPPVPAPASRFRNSRYASGHPHGARFPMNLLGGSK